MPNLDDLITAVYAARWILVAIAFLTLGGLYALARGDVAFLEKENADLAAENAELRDQHPRIVRLQPRRESSRG